MIEVHDMRNSVSAIAVAAQVSLRLFLPAQLRYETSA